MKLALNLTGWAVSVLSLLLCIYGLYEIIYTHEGVTAKRLMGPIVVMAAPLAAFVFSIATNPLLYRKNTAKRNLSLFFSLISVSFLLVISFFFLQFLLPVTASARLGVPRAQLSVARSYQAAGDDANAFLWMSRAVGDDDAGDTDAQATLGMMYAEGVGVRRDPKKALEYLERAARRGSVLASVYAGSMYWKGDGVPPDMEVAAPLLDPVRAGRVGRPVADGALSSGVRFATVGEEAGLSILGGKVGVVPNRHISIISYKEVFDTEFRIAVVKYAVWYRDNKVGNCNITVVNLSRDISRPYSNYKINEYLSDRKNMSSWNPGDITKFVEGIGSGQTTFDKLSKSFQLGSDKYEGNWEYSGVDGEGVPAKYKLKFSSFGILSEGVPYYLVKVCNSLDGLGQMTYVWASVRVSTRID